MLYVYVRMKEDAGALLESLGRLGGVETHGASRGAQAVHIGVAAEVVIEAARYVLSLRHDADALGCRLVDGVHEEWVVGATKDDGVDERILGEQLGDALTDKKICSLALALACLYDGSPEGACLTCHLNVGVELGYLQIVTLTAHGALSGYDAYVTALRELADDLYRRTYDAQDAVTLFQKRTVAAITDGVGTLREVVLLYGAQSLCRGGVTPQDDKTAAEGEECHHCLTRELIHYVKTPRTVGRAGIVAEVYEVPVRQLLAQLLEDGETTITGVEYAYRRVQGFKR